MTNNDPTYLLNVQQSLTGRSWLALNLEHERMGASIANKLEANQLVGRVLARLNVTTHEANDYLTPTLRALMPDPSSFKDMDVAVKRFLTAIKQQQKIAIFADYDVDGASSAALLVDWLQQMGQTATIYTPDRIDEGYGPNEKAMAMLAESHDLIICVDCGTVSYGAISAAKNADVMVLDHHMGGETMPDVVALVNPNRQDEVNEHTYLCAAAIVFLFLVGVNRVMREDNKEPLPDLMQMLDLVALATVADVASLQGVNRAFVRQGLTILKQWKRPGLRALAEVAEINSAPTNYHLGFVLGPRINAGGRVGAAGLGARLLSTNDSSEADALAERLHQLNLERREIEQSVLATAIEQVELRGNTDAALIWAAAEGWHPGVVGIVASRLKEKYNRPTIVIGFTDGIGKASGRSVSGIDLGSAIATCNHENLLLTGGGHKMAAGLSFAETRLDAVMARLNHLLEIQGATKLGTAANIKVDGIILPSAATLDLMQMLESAGPFGAGAPSPRVLLPSQTIHYAKRVGDTHLSLTLGDGVGKIQAICFNAYDSELGTALENHRGKPFHVVGKLTIDEWGGRKKVKLRVEDAAFPE